MAKDDGGSAFPIEGVEVHRVGVAASLGIEDANERERVYIETTSRAAAGMSLRDYFAAAALQGLIASNDEGAGDRLTDIPEYAYQIADAMLAERNK